MQQQKNTYNNSLKKLLCAGGVFSLSVAWMAPALAQPSETVDALSAADSVPSTKLVEPEQWNAKFQATYVWQRKPAFDAPYTGANSLVPQKERSYSFTTTASMGYRPWAGGEAYLDLEAAQGVPLSGLTGLGGFPNGELARTSGATLKAYRARAFVRQTWGYGGGQEAQESEAGQLAGMVDKRRLVLTAGNLSVIDIFDGNAYNHDPRTQFMNWALMTHGAYDYAADARGYTWGAVLEWYYDDWALRFGRFVQPKEPNGQPLDSRFFKHYGDQLELEHAHVWAGQPGKLRALVFRNHSVMSRYSDALKYGTATATTPDLDAVRHGVQTKWGFGLNLEQALTNDVGLFARGSWADGKTETYAFTEIDRSLSAGLLVRGSRWGRAQDTVGLGLVRNYLSATHRGYLAAGGMGPFIGDGQLRYKPETIFESFYSISLVKGTFATFDWQHIRNPAYNAARGPVNVFSLRLHTEF